MTFLANRLEDFVAQAVSGLCRAYPEVVRRIPGGVMRSTQRRPGKVAVVVGGGSGHYPAFAGMVGYGLADAAVVGDIFASPSARQAQSVCVAADQGAGVLMLFGNYAGDVLNFGAAARQLNDLGRDVRCLTVTDDIVSDDDVTRRRGIAGDVIVFKIAGAAAEAGYDLDALEAVSGRANAAVRSYGVAFGGCTLPGAEKPLFSVPPGTVALGLGVHGEPGIGSLPLPDASSLAAELVQRILHERPPGSAPRVAALLNGLGSVKYEELFVLWDSVATLLEGHGLVLVAPEVGEFVTSLDMAGCSLTVAWLDEELEALWLAPALATGFHRGNSPTLHPDTSGVLDTPSQVIVAAVSDEGRAAGRQVAHVVTALHEVLAAHSGHLGELDAVAGDGDHGLGMTRGAGAAHSAADEAVAAGAGPRAVLAVAADAWADRGGGTSGALWGAGLSAVAAALPEDEAVAPAHVADGIRTALSRVRELGGAERGDKTLVDALEPFVACLDAQLAGGAPLHKAWEAATAAADDGARSTALIPARLGRSRVLGDQSVGTEDPGAASMALCLRAAGGALCGSGHD